MTNTEVVARFLRRQPARTTNLVSTGSILLSYGWWEMAKWVNSVLYIRQGISHSTSTSRQRRLLAGTGEVARHRTDRMEREMKL